MNGTLPARLAVAEKARITARTENVTITAGKDPFTKPIKLVVFALANRCIAPVEPPLAVDNLP